MFILLRKKHSQMIDPICISTTIILWRATHKNMFTENRLNISIDSLVDDDMTYSMMIWHIVDDDVEWLHVGRNPTMTCGEYRLYSCYRFV
jgi:hypothetical protein